MFLILSRQNDRYRSLILYFNRKVRETTIRNMSLNFAMYGTLVSSSNPSMDISRLVLVFISQGKENNSN